MIREKMINSPDFGAEKIKSRETKDSIETVRVLLSRSARSEKLEELIESLKIKDLSDIDLVEAVLIEKSKDAHNPGQIMPVGGKVESNETKMEAVAREVLYETHLRLSQAPTFLGEMEYQIPNRNTRNHSSVYATKILPGDIGFPLTPEEDKIASVHYLSLTDFELLLITGKLRKNGQSDLVGREDVLQDGLRTDWLKGSQTDEQRQAQEIKIKMLDYLKSQQSLKRREVLLDFIVDNEELWQELNLSEQMDEYERKLWRAHIDINGKSQNSDYYQKLGGGRHLIDYVWSDIFCKLDDKIFYDKSKRVNPTIVNQIKTSLIKAIETSNLSEELKGENAGRSEAEIVLRFMFTMLETRSFADSVLEPAKENPKLALFAQKLEFFLKNPIGKKKKKKKKSIADSREEFMPERLIGLSEKIGDSLNNSKETEKIEQNFIRVFNLAPNGLSYEKQISIVTQKLNKVNKFLYYLIHEGLEKKIHESFMPEMLEPLNSIKNGDLNHLLKLALPMRKDSQRYKQLKNEYTSNLRLAVFEARRHIGLLIVLSPLVEYYEKIESQSMWPIERVFQKVFSGPENKMFLHEINNENNELMDVIVDYQPCVNVDNGNSFDDESNKIKEIQLRKFKGEIPFLAWVDVVRDKEMESVFRKFLEKALNNPEEIKDIKRRAIVLSPDESVINNERLRVNGELNKLFESGVLSLSEFNKEEKEELTERPEVIQIIKELINKGEGRIRISNYTPTGTSGQGFASKSAGGEGNKLRFAKFNIEYNDNKGKKIIEEVQIFSPSSDGKSGFYWKEIKSRDDFRYFIDRLFKTKTLRSLAELLFPVQIYYYYIRTALVSALSSHRHKS